MSTDYHVRCTTCSVNMDADWHGPFGPRAVISSLPMLLAMAKGIPDTDVEILLDQRPVSLSWLLAHEGHVLEVYDEFNKRDNQCYAWAKCPMCATKHPCVLDLDHAGDHQPKKLA